MLAAIETNGLEKALGSAGGIVGLLIGACLIYNAILWLFLPWIIVDKMNTMIKCLKNIETAVEATERNSRPAGAPRSESSIKYKMPGPND